MNIIKYKEQDVIDFVVTNYGSVEYFKQFLNDMGYNSYMDYYSDTRKTLKLEPLDNEVVNTYRQNSIVTSSIIDTNFQPDILFNNDLMSKTIIGGSFDSSFDHSFDVNTLETIQIGYEGMTAYITFSYTNNGIVSGIASGTLTFTGYSPITFNELIPAGETKVFTYTYTNVQAGIKYVTVSGMTIILEVLGKSNFVSNEDLHISPSAATYYDGDLIDVIWSIDNDGSSSGVYSGIFQWTINGEQFSQSYMVNILAGGTYTFSKSFTLVQGIYNFISTSGQTLSLTVQQSIVLPNIVYNSDLTIIPLYPANNTYVTAKWSVTNTGANGYTSGYIQYYNDDQLNNKQWTSSPTPIANGQTIQFSKTFRVFGGLRHFKLTGDANHEFTFFASVTGAYKDAMCLSTDYTNIMFYNQPVETLPLGTTRVLKVRLLEPNGIRTVSRIQMIVNSESSFLVDYTTPSYFDQFFFLENIQLNAPNGFEVGFNMITFYLDNQYAGQLEINLV